MHTQTHKHTTHHNATITSKQTNQTHTQEQQQNKTTTYTHQNVIQHITTIQKQAPHENNITGTSNKHTQNTEFKNNSKPSKHKNKQTEKPINKNKKCNQKRNIIYIYIQMTKTQL